MKWNEDEEIQRKVDIFGAGGTNLLDPKCGTTYYKNWFDKQRQEAEEQEPEEDFEEVQKSMDHKKKIYDLEIQRMISNKKQKPNLKDKKIK